MGEYWQVDLRKLLESARQLGVHSLADAISARIGLDEFAGRRVCLVRKVERLKPPKLVKICKPARHVIPAALRQFILEMYGRKCLRCGSIKLLQVDHIIPRFRGGDDSIGNLQVLCWGCNSGKGYHVLVDYRWSYWPTVCSPQVVPERGFPVGSVAPAVASFDVL